MFSPFCGLPFYSVDCILLCTKVFNFDNSNLSTFTVIFKKSLPNPLLEENIGKKLQKCFMALTLDI